MRVMTAIFVIKERMFASVLFVIGTIGYAASNAFYDALLPGVSTPSTMNAISDE